MISLKNIDFTPYEWHYNRKKRREMCVIVTSIVVWLIDMSLAVSYLKKYDKLSDVRNEINRIDKGMAEFKNKDKKEKISKLMTLNAYYSLIENHNLYNNLKSVEIHSKQLQLNLVVNNKNDYINMIDNLETDCKFKIITLSPLQYSDGGYSFSLSLEVMDV